MHATIRVAAAILSVLVSSTALAGPSVEALGKDTNTPVLVSGTVDVGNLPRATDGSVRTAAVSPVLRYGHVRLSSWGTAAFPTGVVLTDLIIDIQLSDITAEDATCGVYIVDMANDDRMLSLAATGDSANANAPDQVLHFISGLPSTTARPLGFEVLQAGAACHANIFWSGYERSDGWTVTYFTPDAWHPATGSRYTATAVPFAIRPGGGHLAADATHLLHALLADEAVGNAGWDLLVHLADAGDREAKR